MTASKKSLLMVLSYLLIIGVGGLISANYLAHSEAAYIVIEGDDVGLSVDPDDKKLFDVVNMYPGQTAESTVNLKNEGPGLLAVELGLELDGDQILQEVLNVTIRNGEIIYYDGSLFDLMEDTMEEAYIPVGEIVPGADKDLDFDLEFMTGRGNETQNKHTDMTWIFSAHMRAPEPAVTGTLFAGQFYEIGTVEVYDYGEETYIVYRLSDEAIEAGWCLTETHLHIGKELDDFPRAGRWGNPIPGRFDYSEEHECVTEFTYYVDLSAWEAGDELKIAAHAAVEKRVNGEVVDEESAWGAEEQGKHRFTEQGNWATYFYYEIPTE